MKKQNKKISPMPPVKQQEEAAVSHPEEEVIVAKPIDPLTVQRLITTCPSLNIIHILLHKGQLAVADAFPIHTGLAIQLRNAYKREDSEIFLNLLEIYLFQAQIRLTQIPPAEKLYALLSETRLIMKTLGFIPVARYLLRGI